MNFAILFHKSNDYWY